MKVARHDRNVERRGGKCHMEESITALRVFGGERRDGDEITVTAAFGAASLRRFSGAGISPHRSLCLRR